MGTRILTVEDDERIRTSVRLALEDEGWTVEEAASGEDALNAFTREAADVVLIDIIAVSYNHCVSTAETLSLHWRFPCCWRRGRNR